MQTDKTHKHYKQWLAHMKCIFSFTNVAVLGFQLRCEGQRIRWRADGLRMFWSTQMHWKCLQGCIQYLNIHGTSLWKHPAALQKANSSCMNAILTQRAMIEAEVTLADIFPRSPCYRGVPKMELTWMHASFNSTLTFCWISCKHIRMPFLLSAGEIFKLSERSA